MATFLATQGRYIVPMLPDGNCMFRSVVHQLVGDAEQHTQLRQATVAFTAQNGDTLKGYLTDSHGGHVSLQHHLNKMGNLGSWGTHVELKAMASMLQLPIYVLTDSLVPGGLDSYLALETLLPFLVTHGYQAWVTDHGG